MTCVPPVPSVAPKSLSAASASDDERPHTLSVDVGSTWIRALVLDGRGHPVRPLHEVGFAKTPSHPTPEALMETVTSLGTRAEPFGRASIGFPGVLHDGIVCRSAVFGPEWMEVPLAPLMELRLRCPVKAVRAIDLHGWGVIHGRGTELLLAVGSRMDVALFRDGVPVPNMTLGKYRPDPARFELDGPAAWTRRLWKTAADLRKRFHYDWLYIGGPYAGRMGMIPLPSDVTITASLNGLLGGVAPWDGRRYC